MRVVYLGFILLVWFPGALHAQTAAHSCDAPVLDGGFFVPAIQTHAHGNKITYACHVGHKPAAKRWWASSTCLNDTWVPKPLCINETGCFPPKIPNAYYKVNPNGWYNKGQKIRIRCHEGYEPKDRDATAVCENGTWSHELVCNKRSSACGEPPRIPHAVIINQEYLDSSVVDSVVHYQCQDGYTVEGVHKGKSVICIAGEWDDVPTCSCLGVSHSLGTC